MLRRLGFAVYRRGDSTAVQPAGTTVGSRQVAEAAALAPYRGRWVAQDGLDILYDADSLEAVLRWLRRHGRQARVWRVPASAREAGSALSTP